MKQTLALLLLIAVVIGLSACATTEETNTQDSGVSTIPWNRPESWEGKGPLGGFSPGH